MFDPMEFEIDEPEKVVYVVGIGPGDVYYLTQEAQNVLEHADAICGYKLYLDLIEPEFPCEEYYSTGMTKAAAGRWKRRIPASGSRWCAAATQAFTAWPALCWSWRRITRTLP